MKQQRKYLLNVYLFIIYLHIYARHTRKRPWKSQEGIRLYAAGVTDS